MRELVLQIGYEGGYVSVFAEIGVGERRFRLRDDPAFEEPPHESSVSMTWEELLERELRPNQWLCGYPMFVHPSIADLVFSELQTEPATHASARWWAAVAVRPLLPAREGRVSVDFFECSETARALRLQGVALQNRPKEPATWAALENLKRRLLDPIAAAFGVVTITYGFAGPELVRAVKKRASAEGRLPNITPLTDQHAGHERDAEGRPICARGGVAVDLKVAGTPSMEVSEWVWRNLPFDRIYRYPPMSPTDPVDRPFHLSWAAEPTGLVVDMVPRKGGGLRPQLVRRGRVT